MRSVGSSPTKVNASTLRPPPLRSSVHSSWFRMQGSGVRIHGSGFRVQGSGFRGPRLSFQ